MTAIGRTDGPTANLVETYFRLAQATPGACLWQRGNLRGCTGAFAHPICNFAVAAELDERDFDELARIVRGRDPFQAYVLPGQIPHEYDDRLAQVGLNPTYRLRQMVAPPVHEVARLQPIEATNYASRLALARFMAGQFFLAQPRQYREGIAKATARAGGLDLYAVGFRDAIVGSVMLCRDGDTLGIYNLCIATEHRNQGWGRNILDWARTVAGIEGRIVTLQCDERLATWYRRSGFTEVGEISAYVRSGASTFDTM